MPRRPYTPYRIRHRGGNITFGTTVIGERPELEKLISHCLIAWPIAESELGLTLGQLLGIGSEAALAVFTILRRSMTQRDAIFAAAETVLNEQDLELMSALLDVHKSIEAERTSLAHGHFGVADVLPDGILWTTANDYVQLKAKIHLANMVLTDDMMDDLVRRVFYYKKDDLVAIYNDIEYCTSMWPEAINWLRARQPLRDQLYRQLCDQPRIARALATLRQKNNRKAQPQPSEPTQSEQS